MKQDPCFLEIQRLTIQYGDFVAVDDFSLTIAEGSLTCLVGPSGCGKSSILRSLGGFLRPAKGTIRLAGETLEDQGGDGPTIHIPPENRPIATVFQSYALFPHMNVRQNICYGLKLRKVPKADQAEALTQMLDRLDLKGYADKRVQELSGGEQQRVALARSLIIQPRLLLLDEPLSNLDAKLRVALRAELKQVQRDFGVTTLLVTHDQAEAFELGEKIVLLDRGRKVEEGTPRALYESPHAPFTQAFLGESSGYPREGLALRPEAWALLPPGAGPYPARVLRQIFQGPFFYYDCLLAESPAAEAEVAAEAAAAAGEAAAAKKETAEAKAQVRLLVLNTPDAYLPEVGDLVSLAIRK